MISVLLWSAVALQVVLETLSVVFKQLAAPFSITNLLADAAFAISVLGFAAVGSLIISRRPEHLVGRLFCLVNLGWTINNFAGHYAYYALVMKPGTLPLGELMVWAYSWPGYLSTGLLIASVLVFPDGRPPSRSWRPLVWVVAFVALLGAVAAAFAPGPVSDSIGFKVANPLGAEGTLGDLLRSVSSVAFPLFLPLIGAAVASLAVRFRRGQGVERQQLKWFTSGFALLALFFLAQIAIFVTFRSMAAMPEWAKAVNFFGILAFELILPVAAGIAILRYRLYDIDLLINRTLVYGALSASLALVYLASVLVLQAALAPFTGGSEPAAAASTLAVVALFQPLRSRIQGAVDRRFYRSRYDAARTLDAFSIRLRDEVDLDEVRADLIGAVGETVRPAHASVWLRAPREAAR